MTEYKILTANGIDVLEKLVTDYVENVWKPQGGIYSSGVIKNTFYQSMIKEDVVIEKEQVPFKSRSKN